MFFPKVATGSGADQTTRISVFGIWPKMDRQGPIPLPVDINTDAPKDLGHAKHSCLGMSTHVKEVRNWITNDLIRPVPGSRDDTGVGSSIATIEVR
ncbi:hypothetical protein Q7P35_002303 [Cladosporium inversicolor]